MGRERSESKKRKKRWNSVKEVRGQEDIKRARKRQEGGRTRHEINEETRLGREQELREVKEGTGQGRRHGSGRKFGGKAEQKRKGGKREGSQEDEEVEKS